MELSARNFGLLIAYVIPGFVALWGLSWVSDGVLHWFQGSPAAGPSVGGALFVLLASVACGMTVNALRWASIDQLHHLTGLSHPEWDDSRLQEHLDAFDYLVQNHFRYYQFYAASIVSVLLAYACWRHSGGTDHSGGAEFAVSVLVGVFLAASRDSLRKYYSGTALLVGTITKECSHDERTASSHQVDGKSEVSNAVRECHECAASDAGRGEYPERLDAGEVRVNNSVDAESPSRKAGVNRRAT